MARRHGRNSRLYVGLAGASAVAEPVAFLTDLKLASSTDTPEVTAYGDPNKVYVSGLPDASGDFSGFYDDATVQTYTASQDGAARKFYLYMDIVNDVAQYWFGTAFFDFQVDSSVSGPVKITGKWVAASAISKVG